MIISRDLFLSALNSDWAILPTLLQELQPSRCQAYLVQQGYPDNPSGLLGHILSWWQDGSQVIEKMRSDPNYKNPDYDVDAFNARAVERFTPLSLPEAIAVYQAMREKMIALVVSLPDSELLDERINTRLRYEIIGHLEEHPLPQP